MPKLKMTKGEMIRILIAIVGYPTGGSSWLLNTYCVTVVTTITGIYLWARYLEKYLAAQVQVNVYDKFQAVTFVSSPAVLTVMATNVYHLLLIIKRPRTFSRVFQNGKVFGALGGFDVVIMLLSSLTFVPAMNRKASTFSAKARIISFGPVVNLNYFIAFQFCAVLKHQSKRISYLSERMESFVGTQKQARGLALMCAGRHNFIVSEVLKSSRVFSVQMFVVVAHILIDIIQFWAYTISRLMEEEIPPFVLFSWLYMASMRVAMAVYINWRFDGLKTQGDHFYHQLFHLMRRKSELCLDNRIALYLSKRRHLVLTACGLFEYGYSLLLSMVGAVATYLVVLVQFSMGS